MSRALLLNLSDDEARRACAELKIEISVIEKLESGGVRLVCTSGGGAQRLRHKLRANMIDGAVTRSRMFSRGMQPFSSGPQPEPKQRPIKANSPVPFSPRRDSR